MPKTKFGLFFPQTGASFRTIKERAQLADRLGYDSMWFVDHFWSRGLPDLDHLEAWTLMASVAAVTERLRIGTLVVCNSYRNPALVAKMTASLDNISGGRFGLGIGAGWMDEEYRAYGYPFPSMRARIDQLDEALHVIKRMLTEPRATFQGRYYSVDEAINNPKSVQQPHPPILIGGAGEKRMLRLVAEHADIWNCPNNAAPQLQHKIEVLHRHCQDVGRNPEEIEVSEQCIVVLGRDAADLERKLQQARSTVGKVFDIDTAGLVGAPEQLIDAIEARRQQGVTFFTMMFGDLNQAETLELFAEKVAPAFA
ncbi:MAG TPA: TIGR03560 family F420-dependent LLM class oxidoreductase [Terriglobales bacterium]|nr:TIGR03560 family F420-dependent LLM class oxidoreductase [Terriglobales bacterium]